MRTSFSYIIQVSLMWTALAAVAVFMIASIVLFINDGKKAKLERRKRKEGITIIFIISMAALLTLFMGAIVIMLISMAAIRGM